MTYFVDFLTSYYVTSGTAINNFFTNIIHIQPTITGIISYCNSGVEARKEFTGEAPHTLDKFLFENLYGQIKTAFYTHSFQLFLTLLKFPFTRTPFLKCNKRFDQEYDVLRSGR